MARLAQLVTVAGLAGGLFAIAVSQQPAVPPTVAVVHPPAEPKAQPKRKAVVIPDLAKPAPIATPEKTRKKKRERTTERPKIKRVAVQQRKPTPGECARMTGGIALIGRDGVKNEARKRGFTNAQVDRALNDCGL